MITQEILSYPIIPYKKLFPSSINEFLELFIGILDLSTIEEGMRLDFVIDTRINNPKVRSPASFIVEEAGVLFTKNHGLICYYYIQQQ